MIVFLTLIYVAVLALLVRLGVVKLNLWWKLSPVVWMLLLLIVLFIPMQWGAPSGAVNVYVPVVEIVPSVSGEVVEVAVEGSKPLAKGDVLFRIDPDPYQDEVDRLRAALKQAEQEAQMLPADVANAEAEVASADARIVESKQKEETLRYGVEVAVAAIAKAKAELKLAQATLKRDEVIYQRSPGAVTEQEMDVLRAKVRTAQATLQSAAAQEKQAVLAYESQIGGVNTTVARATEERKQAAAGLSKAQLALESTINGENTKVAQLRAQLSRAEYDLSKTTVTAPANGHVVGLTLRPGQRVAAFPVRSWMAFVDQSRASLVVGINQYAMRHVEPGQPVEVTLKYYPGKTFAGTVEKVIYITPEGQVQPQGIVPTLPGKSQPALPLGVSVLLDEPGVEISQLPGGASGTAAIYTDVNKATHLIRRVMIRMQSFINYVLPG